MSSRRWWRHRVHDEHEVRLGLLRPNLQRVCARRRRLVVQLDARHRVPLTRARMPTRCAGSAARPGLASESWSSEVRPLTESTAAATGAERESEGLAERRRVAFAISILFRMQCGVLVRVGPDRCEPRRCQRSDGRFFHLAWCVRCLSCGLSAVDVPGTTCATKVLNTQPANRSFVIKSENHSSIRLHLRSRFASEALPFAELAQYAEIGFRQPSQAARGAAASPEAAANVVETAATRRWLLEQRVFPLFTGSTGLTRKLSS